METIIPICYGSLKLSFESPKLMGILNLTPDSFYSKSRVRDIKTAISTCENMIEEGATIIDLGAVSTRPGATTVTEGEELHRLLPYIKRLSQEFPETWFSVDTFRARVARRCIEAGASIINDISGGMLDPDMDDLLTEYQIPYILMHMHGTPATMQLAPLSKEVVTKVSDFFQLRVSQLKQKKITQIILDPGYGFGKSTDGNYLLLKHQESLRIDNFPILAGVSRKSMIHKLLSVSPELSLNGTTAIHILALLNGANILRVHDVREAREAITIFNQYQQVDPLP